jgi:hypothetical protein
MPTLEQVPEPVAPHATAAEAASYVRRLVRFIGPGFHPDEPFENYVSGDAGRKSFTSRDCRRLRSGLMRAWRILDAAGVEIYSVGLKEQRRLLRRLFSSPQTAGT